MKVLQINSVCGIGSTGRIASDLHKTLLSKGHESYIAFGRGEAIDCDNTIRIGSKLDNYWHVAVTRLFDCHGFASKRATRDFIDQVERLDPDIIHLHNIHGYYLHIETLFEYLKTANTPVIWTLHDCWAFTGHCAYFDYVGCNRWKNGCYDCPHKSNYPTSIFWDASERNYIKKKEKFTGVRNLTLISPSRWLADLVRQSYLQDYPVKVINNGIDLSVFTPTKSTFRQKHDLEDKTIVLGVANVWENRKGFDYFIHLAKLLDERFQIVMVGLTDKEKKGLPKNIIGITRTKSAKELAEIYTAADVFVNPTLEEVFGMTNVEALACGTPVITFDSGGSPECIDDSCGLVIKKTNAQALALAIKNLTNNMFSEDDCVNRAKLFENTTKYKEYLNLYSSVLGIRRIG